MEGHCCSARAVAGWVSGRRGKQVLGGARGSGVKPALLAEQQCPCGKGAGKPGLGETHRRQEGTVSAGVAKRPTVSEVTHSMSAVT